MHVLLIEPDKILSNIYVRSLVGAGHTVAATMNAQHAIQLADEQQPDLVIVELQLKGHNGVEFLYEFRSYQEWLTIPVLVHSFVPPTEFVRTPLLTQELGVNDYLYKPTTSLAKLIQAVQKLVPIKAL
ncbi:MAG: response regulator [Candidatus Saccharimonadales bacterium]